MSTTEDAYQTAAIKVPDGGLSGREMTEALKRMFPSGATRDTDTDKYDYAGFLSPLVLAAFAEYMHKHRTMKDGTVRGSDNWKQGFPPDVSYSSLWRHFMDLAIMIELNARELYRPDGEHVTKNDALAAVWFNVQAIWLQEIQHGE